MKLSRSELKRELSQELFEIAADNFREENAGFFQDTLSVILSSRIIPSGFKVFGTIEIPFQFICDRCLAQFTSPTKLDFEIWLAPDRELVESEEIDVVWFPESMEEIDLLPIIKELILLEVPIKILCSEACLGLCSGCGVDLNQNKCICRKPSIDQRWEALKNIQP